MSNAYRIFSSFFFSSFSYSPQPFHLKAFQLSDNPIPYTGFPKEFVFQRIEQPARKPYDYRRRRRRQCHSHSSRYSSNKWIRTHHWSSAWRTIFNCIWQTEDWSYAEVSIVWHRTRQTMETKMQWKIHHSILSREFVFCVVVVAVCNIEWDKMAI